MIQYVIRGVRRFLGGDSERDPLAELVELMSVAGAAQAHVIRGSLEARGIPATIRHRTPISTFAWQMPMSSSYEIWVRGGHVKRALALVEAGVS